MNKKLILGLLVVLIIAAGIFVVFEKNSKTATSSQTETPSASQETDLLTNVAVWYPSAPWSPPAESTQTTMYGTLTGQIIKAQITSQNPMVEHFESTSELHAKGFVADINLDADGPGASSWGYKKEINVQEQFLIFSYRTHPTNTNPDQPVEFNCPCTIDLEVFIGNTPTKQ